MAKLSAADAARALAASRPAHGAYLLYGPDVGLVRERADHLAAMVVDDANDPFRVAILGERDILDDPARVSDELAARSLMGGRRVVRVRDGGDRLGAALGGRLPADPEDALLLVEAGELTPRSALRRLFENAPGGPRGAAAIACYADDAKALAAVIDDNLRQAGLSATQDARALLAAMLGADRRATRTELAKLADYMGDTGQVEADDVLAVIADDTAQAADALAFAVLAGAPAEASRHFRRLLAAGLTEVALIRTLARQVQRALIAADLVARGQPASEAMKALRPPVFYKDADRFRAILRRHTVASLRRIMSRLWEVERRVKSTGYPADIITGQILLAIAAASQARG